MILVDWDRGANWAYAQALARAFAGAIIFSLPLLMTMEMWYLGFYLDRGRLLLFVAVNFLILIVLSRLSGFEPTETWADDVLDALAAFTVAVVAATITLLLIGVIDARMPPEEMIGKIAVQSVPASFGAMLASKALAGRGDDDDVGERERRARGSYFGELFLMLAGALFLAFNLAPTEEIILISFQMSPLHSIALILASILILHALVYTVGFKGEHEPGGASGFLGTFARFSIVGYGIAVLASFYVLWTFGRLDGVDPARIASITAVLGFPGAIGAAIARLVV